MEPMEAVGVAVNTKCANGEVLALLDVMRLARAWCAANTASERLDSGHVGGFVRFDCPSVFASHVSAPRARNAASGESTMLKGPPVHVL